MTVLLERGARDGSARQGRVAGAEGGDGEEARRPHDVLQPARVRNAKAGKSERGSTYIAQIPKIHANCEAIYDYVESLLVTVHKT